MARELMVPLDGTRFAEAALPTAVALARRDGARVRLVSAWRPLPPTESDSSWEKERMEWQEEDRGRLEGYLAETAARVARASGSAVEVEMLEGAVDEVLPRWCAETAIDLAVMATHAHGPVIRAWIGSVAEHMVRRGHHPVLLIHPSSEEPGVDLEAGTPFRRVLVPLDGSPLAETALDKSLLAGETGEVDLVLLRVVPFAAGSVPLHVPEPLAAEDQSSEEARGEAEAYLAEASGRLAGWARRVEARVEMDPHVAPAIVARAEEEGADLIAMATHGRGRAARVVLGSVADRVMRTSPVPVLLCPRRSGR